MLRSWRWRAAAILAPAAMMAAAMFTGATAASAATTPTWQLVNEFAGTTVCDTPGNTDALQVYLSGTWSTPITVGASNLPAGGFSSFLGRIADGYRLVQTDSPIIQPGSAIGNGVIVFGPRHTEFAYVEVTLPAGVAVGSTVTVMLSATDGTTTQTEPVTIGVQNSCTVF